MFDQYKWNKYSIAEASGAAMLLVLILFLAKSTYHNIRFEYTYRDALNKYASRQFGLMESPLSSAVSHNPSFPHVHLLQGVLFLRKDQFKNAYNSFGKAIKRGPSSRVRNAGRLGKAVTRIRQFDRTEQNEHLDDAESLLRRIRKSGHFAQESRVHLGVVHLRRYDQTGGEQHLKDARDAFDAVRNTLADGGNLTRPAFEDYLSGSGDTLFWQGSPTEARTRYERLHQLNPNRAHARINRAFALARFYARGSVPKKQSTRERIKRRTSFLEGLLRRAESGDTSLGDQYRAAAVQLGLALLPVCHARHGNSDVCKDLRTLSPHLKSKREKVLYDVQRSRSDLTAIDRHAQTLQRNPEQLDRDARKSLEQTSALLKELRNMDPSGPADAYLTSTLARTEFVLQHWHPERLRSARSLFLELLNEHEIDEPSLYRNLCLVFYARNDAVSRDRQKARRFGRTYLDRTTDESFRDWFQAALTEPGGGG